MNFYALLFHRQFQRRYVLLRDQGLHYGRKKQSRYSSRACA